MLQASHPSLRLWKQGLVPSGNLEITRTATIQGGITAATATFLVSTAGKESPSTRRRWGGSGRWTDRGGNHHTSTVGRAETTAALIAGRTGQEARGTRLVIATISAIGAVH